MFSLRFTSASMIVAALFPVPASHQPPSGVPGGFASWGELAAMQIELNAAATRIQLAAASAPGGYAGVIAAPENRRLDLYWKGSVPEAIEAVIERERATVPIRVLEADYSADELIAEARRLGQDPAVLESAPLPDGSGIHLRLAGGRAAASPMSAAKPAVRWACEHFCRDDDSSPYYGGARTGNCTAGFAVTWKGSTRLLYAGHCGSDHSLVRDGGGQPMGNLINDNDFRDTAMIDARSAGRMWEGRALRKTVREATFSNVGNWLCNAGSRSGVICGIQVRLNHVTRDGKFPMVAAERTGRRQAGGPGDSGGPVFEPPPPGDSRVIAKGIIYGGDPATTVPCTVGETHRTGCAWRYFYADVTQTLAFYGAAILEGDPDQVPAPQRIQRLT